jgi:hypothetical protein
LCLLVSLAALQVTRKRLVVLGTHRVKFGRRVLRKTVRRKLEPDAADEIHGPSPPLGPAPCGLGADLRRAAGALPECFPALLRCRDAAGLLGAYAGRAPGGRRYQVDVCVGPGVSDLVLKPIPPSAWRRFILEGLQSARATARIQSEYGPPGERVNSLGYQDGSALVNRAAC